MAPLPYDSEDGASRLAILGRALLVVVLLLEGLYLVDLARPGGRGRDGPHQPFEELDEVYHPSLTALPDETHRHSNTAPTFHDGRSTADEAEADVHKLDRVSRQTHRHAMLERAMHANDGFVVQSSVRPSSAPRRRFAEPVPHQVAMESPPESVGQLEFSWTKKRAGAAPAPTAAAPAVTVSALAAAVTLSSPTSVWSWTSAAIQHEGVSGELTRGQHAELLNPVTAGVLERQPLYATRVAVSLQATTSSCKQDCQGRGVCNLETGRCACRSGYSGDACEARELYPCNTPQGNAILSRCAGSCDEDRNKCYCGEGSAFPQRAMYKCYFDGVQDAMPWESPEWDNWAHGPRDALWGEDGWCNFDLGKQNLNQLSVRCGCYDGWEGPLCNVPTESYCLNHCSDRGTCNHGFCECRPGFFGVDCSIQAQEEETQQTVSLLRPLVYVYELPTEFNVGMLEQRVKKAKCTVRYYGDRNNTRWEPNLYGAELIVYESLLRSKHRTLNPEEADFFFVPFFASCFMSRFLGPTARHRLAPHEHTIERVVAEYKRVYEHVSTAYPYWNRHGGRDHMWMMFHDEGACFAPKEIWPSIMITHWGRKVPTTMPNCTHTFYAHSWTEQYMSRQTRLDTIGDHACYDPAKDVVVPSWRAPRTIATSPFVDYSSEERAGAAAVARNLTFFFRGDVRNDKIEYSMGIRQQVYELMKGKEAEGFVMADGRDDRYHLDLTSSKFCGVFPGNGWSGRMEEAILHGCIPVIIQDEIHVPFETSLDTSQFAIRYERAKLNSLIEFLSSVSHEEVARLKANIARVWTRYYYGEYVQEEVAWRARRGYERDPLLDSIAAATRGKEDAVSTMLLELWQRRSTYPRDSR